jgi:uncharacterized protein YbjT (DUF2867 family)
MTQAIAIVAGATGLIGKELVRQLAASSEWTEVRALARGAPPPQLAAPKVLAVKIDYAALEPPPAWAEVDHVFCALGTTIKQAGTQDAFRKVDFDYPLAIAKAARAKGARHFLMVSALGASARSSVFYSRVKGEIEEAVSALGFRSVTIARPSMLVGRVPPRRTEGLAAAVGFLVPRPWRPVHASSVARRLIESARDDRPGVRILENADLLGAE